MALGPVTFDPPALHHVLCWNVKSGRLSESDLLVRSFLRQLGRSQGHFRIRRFGDRAGPQLSLFIRDSLEFRVATSSGIQPCFGRKFIGSMMLNTLKSGAAASYTKMKVR